MYNFDKIIDRKNTGSEKHDFAKESGVPEEALPLWVADMDFCSPQEVIDALVKRMEHGVFGYTDVKPDGKYFEALSAWMKERHNWQVKPEWLVKTPGVVFAIAMAIQAFTKPGDAILIQEPVYHPFARTVRLNGRKLVENSLVNNSGHYEIDFDTFEKQIKENNVKLFVFCSPHNPVGRVWKKEELQKVAEICLKHNVFVVSDEIHNDFIYPGNTHTVFSTLGEEIAQNCMVCTAPSKTFNVPGFQCSNIFITDQKRRQLLEERITACAIGEINIAGLTACEAAYRYGGAWLDELLKYLHANVDFVRDYLKKNIPEIKMIYPEGTYLLWLDFRLLNLPQNELVKRLLNDCGLWFNDGSIFGSGGTGFMRVNIASPKSVIEEAMRRLSRIAK
ncbi:MAG: pyridoxal phosphate-dependent aminotransferase [Treponema sp.]|nr:pyridoxal phosphate-dependent aminotransferase [Treponema sp.]